MDTFISQAQEKPSGKMSTAMLLLRPRQWTKNLIALAPILFAGKILDGPLLLKVLISVFALCMASSAVYILNDILDRENDKLHPTKKNRPIASGKIPISMAFGMAFSLALAAAVVGFLVRPALALVIATYLALMLFYTTIFKHIVLLDVFSISAGFVLRAIGGAAAASVPVSGWFLLCTSFGSLFLALEKRRQELNVLKGDAQSHRKTLSGYSADLLDRMEGVVVPCVLISYTFYGFQSIHGQDMLLTVPFVLYGVMRYQVLSSTNTLTGTPEEVLLKDVQIQLAILGWLLTSAGVIYGLIPTLSSYIITNVDQYAQFK